MSANKKPASKPPRLSHYTTLDGFKCILEENKFRATNISFLNDRAELQHALNASKNVFKKIEEKKDKSILALIRNCFDQLKDKEKVATTYVTCFCQNHDSLNMWRGYGGQTQGVRLEFETNWLEQVFHSQNTKLVEVQYTPETPGHQWIDDLADEIYREVFIDDILDVPQEETRAKISKIIPRFKHIGFKEEEEWRFIISKESNDGVKFRESGHKLVPFIEIELAKTGEPLPLQQITVGPGPDQELTQRSIKNFLDVKGYGKISVDTTAIPFRV